MASQIERDGARKMSGEDQMMFQDHHPFVDKVRGSEECLPSVFSFYLRGNSRSCNYAYDFARSQHDCLRSTWLYIYQQIIPVYSLQAFI